MSLKVKPKCCAVPHCPNTKEKLLKWFRTPCEIHREYLHNRCGCPEPFFMYPVPKAQSQQRTNWIRPLLSKAPWIDPDSVTMFCSHHFPEGRPTINYPYPTKIPIVEPPSIEEVEKQRQREMSIQRAREEQGRRAAEMISRNVFRPCTVGACAEINNSFPTMQCTLCRCFFHSGCVQMRPNSRRSQRVFLCNFCQDIIFTPGALTPDMKWHADDLGIIIPSHLVKILRKHDPHLFPAPKDNKRTYYFDNDDDRSLPGASAPKRGRGRPRGRPPLYSRPKAYRPVEQDVGGSYSDDSSDEAY